MEETIVDWRSVQRRIPARVLLTDYNDLKPLLPLIGKADVDKKRGFGTYFEYGDHFEVPADGDALAQLRAERFLTEQFTVFGVTDCVRFHVGHTFTLTDHFDSAQNQKYLITEIEHILGPVPGKEDADAFDYELKFRAVPFKVAFRPARQTPWPSVAGVVHAHIDSDSSGKFATLDAKSRYKVRFPFDGAGKKGDASSTWVRMAQSYAGTGYGSHYPLHKGTEVLVAFYDGDPDRPIIVGAVPNAVTPAASTAKNASQSTIRSASGIHIAMDDEL
jgi:type VI secretion system secreted protein VgrG